MRLILCLSVLLASGAWAADEAADRAAIEKVVSRLSSLPNSPGLFTGNFPDWDTLTRLAGVNRTRVSLRICSRRRASQFNLFYGSRRMWHWWIR